MIRITVILNQDPIRKLATPWHRAHSVLVVQCRVADALIDFGAVDPLLVDIDEASAVVQWTTVIDGASVVIRFSENITISEEECGGYLSPDEACLEVRDLIERLLRSSDVVRRAA